jgi:hypothetical protein
VVSSVCLLVRVTMVDKNKAVVCCLLATSAIMLSENKKRKRKILGNDQLDALFLNVFIFMPLHVSSSKCPSSGGPNCINTSSGITHSGE